MLRNFSRPAHALPLKTPSAYSPDQFQSPDYFSTTSHWVLVCWSAQASPSGPFLFDTARNATICRDSLWQLLLDSSPPGITAAALQRLADDGGTRHDIRLAMRSSSHDVPQWNSRWASSLLDMPTYWGSDAFGQKLDTNAAVLPNCLALIIASARRLDSKASYSGSSPSIVCAAFWISNSILRLQKFLTKLLKWVRDCLERPQQWSPGQKGPDGLQSAQRHG